MIADNSAASLEAFVRANVKPGATVITDGHASYPGLAGDYRHDPRVVGVMAANIVLPWSHRAFALMKRWALGTYHGLRRKHVDTYLDEFVFRYNRRFYRHASFETMLGLAADHAPATYRDIVGRESPSKNQIAGDAQPLHVGEPDGQRISLHRAPLRSVSFLRQPDNREAVLTALRIRAVESALYDAFGKGQLHGTIRYLHRPGVFRRRNLPEASERRLRHLKPSMPRAFHRNNKSMAWPDR